jgi:hypothetical protein
MTRQPSPLTNLLIHLAANPESQEINHYLPASDPESWTYESFSKLVRCGAIIVSSSASSILEAQTNTEDSQYETIRICHPLSLLVKTTGANTQSIKFQNNTYTLPAETAVHCSLPALYSHPKYWGSGPLGWNPKNFIIPFPSATNSSPFETETLTADTSEHFMPWAWSQRVCPGACRYACSIV